MKKLLVILLAAVLALGCFVGCGGERPVEGGEETSEGRAESDYADGVTISGRTRNEIYVDTKDGKTRLKLAFTDAGFGSEWLRAIATHFVKENPEYWVFLDGDAGLTELVSTQLSSGLNLPDVYMPLGSDWQSYALVDWLEELSDVYDAKPDGESGKTVYEKLNAAWQDYCITPNGTVDGKYAYPWSMGVSGYVYNGTMFKKYGWEVPTTHAELLALCDRILKDTNGTVKPFIYPGQIGGYFSFAGMAYWLQASGVDGVREFHEFGSAEVFNMNVQPGKGKYEALVAFTELFGPDAKSYSVKGSMSKNHTEAQLSFLKGEAAMIPNASWMETEMIGDIPDGMEIRMMRYPYIDTAKKDGDGNYIKVNYATTPDYMIIPKGAANKEGAKKFLAYISRDDMLKLFTKYTGSLRPFDYDAYDVVKDMSAFTRDCYDIWKTSESYFEYTKAPIARKNGLTAWHTGLPFTKLVYGPEDDDGIGPKRYCQLQYQDAKGMWASWMEKVN